MSMKVEGYTMTQPEHWVHLKVIRNHGLIGLPFVKQHMLLDEQWSARDLMEQFKSMAGCLEKHHQFKRIESEHMSRQVVGSYHRLRKQCRDGRSVLQAIRTIYNRHAIRNLLEDDKEKQCLYQDMPVHQVLENIDQRTFVLRKEHDRLRDRKIKLEKELKDLMLKSANLEDRLKFHNAFELNEERRAKNCEKKLANSNIRLKGIKTINSTYNKIVQILKHDEMFYEPILQSLSDDINDQRMFIEHILDLGKPALQKFKKLKVSFKQYDDEARRDIQSMIHGIATKNKLLNKKPNTVPRYKEDEQKFIAKARERYMLTTNSMAELESELHRVSEIIKNIKFATLCSTATEIFPRIKGQIDHNYKLKKEIVCDSLCHATLETKEKFCDVLQGVIKNNLSQAEIERLGRITELNELIANEDSIEKDNVDALKQNNDVFVILRVFLWNIYDMLRHVYKSPRLRKIQYPNSYLKLPLLKFEMMTMYSCPPDPLDDDIHELYRLIHRKMSHLMSAHNRLIGHNKNNSFTNNLLRSHRGAYMDEITAVLRENEGLDVDMDQRMRKDYSDDDGDNANYESKDNVRPSRIYNRTQMKARSLHFLEEQLKKD